MKQVFLFVILCGGFISGPARSLLAQVDESNLNDFVTKDTFFVAVLRGDHLMRRLGDDHETLAFVGEQMSEHLGIELEHFRSATMTLGGGDDLNESERVAMVFEFSRDFDLDKFKAAMGEGDELTEIEIKGEKAWRMGEHSERCLWMPDKRSFVMAYKDRIGELIHHRDSMPAKSPLVKHVNEESELTAVIDFTNLDGNRLEMLEDMTRHWAPESFQPEMIAEHASTCVFSVQSKSAIAIDLRLYKNGETKSDSLAEYMEEVVKGLKEKSTELLDEMDGAPPEFENTAEVFKTCIEALRDRMEHYQAKDYSGIKLEKMDGFKNAAETIVEAIAMPFVMLSRFGGT